MGYWDNPSNSRAWQRFMYSVYAPEKYLDIVDSLGLNEPEPGSIQSIQSLPETDIDLKAQGRDLVNRGMQGNKIGKGAFDYYTNYSKKSVLQAIADGRLVVEGDEIYRTLKWDDGKGYDTMYEREALPIGRVDDDGNYKPYSYAASYLSGLEYRDQWMKKYPDWGPRWTAPTFNPKTDGGETMSAEDFDLAAGRLTNRRGTWFEGQQRGFGEGLLRPISALRELITGDVNPEEKLRAGPDHEAGYSSAFGRTAGEISRTLLLALAAGGIGSNLGITSSAGRFGLMSSPGLVNIPEYMAQYNRGDAGLAETIAKSTLDPLTMGWTGHIGMQVTKKYIPMLFNTAYQGGKGQVVKTFLQYAGESALKQLPGNVLGVAPHVAAPLAKGEIGWGDALEQLAWQTGLNVVLGGVFDLTMDAVPNYSAGRQAYKTGGNIIESFNKQTAGAKTALTPTTAEAMAKITNYASVYDAFPTKNLVDQMVKEGTIRPDQVTQATGLVDQIKNINARINQANIELEGGYTNVQRQHLVIAFDKETLTPHYQFKGVEEISNDFGVDLSDAHPVAGESVKTDPGQAKMEISPVFAQRAKDMLYQMESFSADKSEEFIRNTTGYATPIEGDIAGMVKEMGSKEFYGKTRPTGSVKEVTNWDKALPDMIRVYNEVTGYKGGDHSPEAVVPIFFKAWNGEMEPVYMKGEGQAENFKYMDSVSKQLALLRSPSTKDKVLARNERGIFLNRVQGYIARGTGLDPESVFELTAKALKLPTTSPVAAKSKFMNSLMGSSAYHMDDIHEYFINNNIPFAAPSEPRIHHQPPGRPAPSPYAKIMPGEGPIASLPDPKLKFVKPREEIVSAEYLTQARQAAEDGWLSMVDKNPDIASNPDIAKVTTLIRRQKAAAASDKLSEAYAKFGKTDVQGNQNPFFKSISRNIERAMDDSLSPIEHARAVNALERDISIVDKHVLDGAIGKMMSPRDAILRMQGIRGAMLKNTGVDLTSTPAGTNALIKMMVDPEYEKQIVSFALANKAAGKYGEAKSSEIFSGEIGRQMDENIPSGTQQTDMLWNEFLSRQTPEGIDKTILENQIVTAAKDMELLPGHIIHSMMDPEAYPPSLTHKILDRVEKMTYDGETPAFSRAEIDAQRKIINDLEAKQSKALAATPKPEAATEAMPGIKAAPEPEPKPKAEAEPEPQTKPKEPESRPKPNNDSKKVIDKLKQRTAKVKKLAEEKPQDIKFTSEEAEDVGFTADAYSGYSTAKIKSVLAGEGFDKKLSSIHFKDKDNNLAKIVGVDLNNKTIIYRHGDIEKQIELPDAPRLYLEKMKGLVSEGAADKKVADEPEYIYEPPEEVAMPVQKPGTKKGFDDAVTEAVLKDEKLFTDDAIAMESTRPKVERPEMDQIKTDMAELVKNGKIVQDQIKAAKAKGEDTTELEKEFADIKAGMSKLKAEKPKDTAFEERQKYFAKSKKTAKDDEAFVKNIKEDLKRKKFFQDRKDIGDELHRISQGKNEARAKEAKLLMNEMLKAMGLTAIGITAAQLLPDDEQYDTLKSVLFTAGFTGRLSALKSRVHLGSRKPRGWAAGIEVKDAIPAKTIKAQTTKASIAGSPGVKLSTNQAANKAMAEELSRALSTGKKWNIHTGALYTTAGLKNVPYIDLDSKTYIAVKATAENRIKAQRVYENLQTQLEKASTEGGVLSIEERAELVMKIDLAEQNLRVFDYAVDLGGNANMGAGAIQRQELKAIADIKKYKDKAGKTYNELHKMGKESQAVLGHARADLESELVSYSKLPKEEKAAKHQAMLEPSYIKDRLKWAADDLGVKVDINDLYNRGWKLLNEWNHNAALAEYNHHLTFMRLTPETLDARKASLEATIRHSVEAARSYKEKLMQMKEDYSGLKDTDPAAFKKMVDDLKKTRTKVVTAMLRNASDDLKKVQAMIDIRDNSNNIFHMYKYNLQKQGSPYALNIWEAVQKPDGTWKRAIYKDTDTKWHEFYKSPADRYKAMGKIFKAFNIKEEANGLYSMDKVNRRGQVVDANDVPVSQSKAQPARVLVAINDKIDMNRIAGYFTNNKGALSDMISSTMHNHGQALPLSKEQLQQIDNFTKVMDQMFGGEFDPELHSLDGDIGVNLNSMMSQFKAALASNPLDPKTQLQINRLLYTLYQPTSPFSRPNRNVRGWQPNTVDEWAGYFRELNDAVFATAEATSVKSYMLSEIIRQQNEIRTFGLTNTPYDNYLESFKKDLLFNPSPGAGKIRVGDHIIDVAKGMDIAGSYMAAKAMAVNPGAQSTNILGSLMSGTTGAYSQGMWAYPLRFVKDLNTAAKYGVQYLNRGKGIKGETGAQGIKFKDNIDGAINKKMMESGLGAETFAGTVAQAYDPKRWFQKMFFLTKGSEFLTRVSTALAYKESLMNELPFDVAQRAYGWDKAKYIDEIAMRSKAFSDSVNGLYRLMDRTALERGLMRNWWGRNLFMLMGPQINNLSINAGAVMQAIKGAGTGTRSRRLAGLLGSMAMSMSIGGVKATPFIAMGYSLLSVADSLWNGSNKEQDIAASTWIEDIRDMAGHVLGKLGVPKSFVSSFMTAMEDGIISAAVDYKSGFDESLQSYSEPYFITAVAQGVKKLVEGAKEGDVGKLVDALVGSTASKIYYITQSVEKGQRLDKLGNPISTEKYGVWNAARDLLFREPLSVAVERERGYTEINPTFSPRQQQDFLNRVTNLNRLTFKEGSRRSKFPVKEIERQIYTDPKLMARADDIKQAIKDEYAMYRTYINSSVNAFEDWVEKYTEAVQALASDGKTLEGSNKDLSKFIESGKKKIGEYYLGLSAANVMERELKGKNIKIDYYSDRKKWSINRVYIKDMPLGDQGLAAFMMSQGISEDDDQEDIMNKIEESRFIRRRGSRR